MDISVKFILADSISLKKSSITASSFIVVITFNSLSNQYYVKNKNFFKKCALIIFIKKLKMSKQLNLWGQKKVDYV